MPAVCRTELSSGNFGGSEDHSLENFPGMEVGEAKSLLAHVLNYLYIVKYIQTF